MLVSSANTYYTARENWLSTIIVVHGGPTTQLEYALIPSMGFRINARVHPLCACMFSTAILELCPLT